MIRLYFLLIVFAWTTPKAFAQFTDSNLPIVLINTGGSSIPDQPRIVATMKIIDNGTGQRNYLADQDDPSKLNYNGKISIEIRGSSSQVLTKKQYGLTTVKPDNVTNNNVSLLGMPEENDWVLNGLAFDPSLVRDYLSYNLSRQIGNYAPRQRYCEVVINNTYQGLYLLQEKIKVDKNRVDLVKLDATENSLPEVSGGYIIKTDKVTSEDPSSWTMTTYLSTQADFINEFPNATSVTGAQKVYIKGYFDKLQAASTNTSIMNGYPSLIDVPSFVDFMLLNEIAANVDAYQFSTFFHKDRNGKLRAGPLWDLNLTFGNDLFFWGLDRSKTNTWQFNNGDNVGPRFWKDLYDNLTFRCYLSRRFAELTAAGQPLSAESVNLFLDQTKDEISEAAVRENSTWGTVGDLATRMNEIKTFVSQRLTWMKSQLGSFSACANITVPSLVISRINYHPKPSAEFPDDDDLEFIEIVNNGSTSADLSGIYFRGLGLSFNFRIGASLPPNGVIQLANNSVAFEQYYGYIPYGEFTRNLSNSSQALCLADAFGNVIDFVEYHDVSPWPGGDGDGTYLKLTDLASDNNVGTNWTLSDDAIASTEIVLGVNEREAVLEVYPVPSRSKLQIKASRPIDAIELRDEVGSLKLQQPGSFTQTELDMSTISPGFYVLSVTIGNSRITKKIIRE